MEDEIEAAPSNAIPIALAVLALVLGGAGLYFGLTANQRLAPIDESLAAGTSTVAEAERQLENYAQSLAAMEAMVEEQAKTVERLRVYVAQSERAVKSMSSEVATNRQQIVKNAENLKKVAEAGGRSAAPVRASAGAQGADAGRANAGTTQGAPEADPAPSPEADGQGSNPAGESSATYAIQSGDTLAGIAARRGIKLDALLAANPEVDPVRLQIGQIIRLPAE